MQIWEYLSSCRHLVGPWLASCCDIILYGQWQSSCCTLFWWNSKVTLGESVLELDLQRMIELKNLSWRGKHCLVQLFSSSDSRGLKCNQGDWYVWPWMHPLVAQNLVSPFLFEFSNQAVLLKRRQSPYIACATAALWAFICSHRFMLL